MDAPPPLASAFVWCKKRRYADATRSHTSSIPPNARQPPSPGNVYNATIGESRQLAACSTSSDDGRWGRKNLTQNVFWSCASEMVC